MAISFDAVKNERNIATRGISFELAAGFEWDSALIIEDTRRDYGERRYQALGLIDGRLHVLVFTPRAGRTHEARVSEIHQGPQATACKTGRI